jgi:hypothetical protein
VWAEQAIFTSIPRAGRAGYHIVSRSMGLREAEATALANCSPSHGSLIVDDANRTSVNFHSLPTGRIALSRTCLGPAEYSGRGERQVYTHALVFDASVLRQAGVQPIALYRDAIALGYLYYQREPEPNLKPVELGILHTPLEAEECGARARSLGFDSAHQLSAQLAEGQQVRLRYSGDRIALAECLLGLLPQDRIAETSFSTSLQPSAVRPFQLVLVD